MTRKNLKVEACGRAFASVVSAYFNYEKRTHFLTDDQGSCLHKTEMNVISKIHDKEGLCITVLADDLSVTVGAVSQILKKLETKGLIVKRKKPEHQSKQTLFLTEKGRMVHENHMKCHEAIDEKFCRLLSDSSDEQIETLTKFLNELNEALSET